MGMDTFALMNPYETCMWIFEGPSGLRAPECRYNAAAGHFLTTASAIVFYLSIEQQKQPWKEKNKRGNPDIAGFFLFIFIPHRINTIILQGFPPWHFPGKEGYWGVG